VTTNQATGSPWRIKLAMTLGAWLFAFLVVLTLLSVFKDELASLPLAARALVLSGVLVTVMTTVVQPALSTAIGHWASRSKRGA
jgi:antibiotic biosynthesis monooxygenase (ABM) superfamily enzyme